MSTKLYKCVKKQSDHKSYYNIAMFGFRGRFDHHYHLQNKFDKLNPKLNKIRQSTSSVRFGWTKLNNKAT